MTTRKHAIHTRHGDDVREALRRALDTSGFEDTDVRVTLLFGGQAELDATTTDG